MILITFNSHFVTPEISWKCTKWAYWLGHGAVVLQILTLPFGQGPFSVKEFLIDDEVVDVLCVIPCVVVLSISPGGGRSLVAFQRLEGVSPVDGLGLVEVDDVPDISNKVVVEGFFFLLFTM